MAGLGSELGRLFKHSAVYGLSNVLGKAIGFLLIPLYTHYISPADYGVLELLDLSVNVIGMFVGMGLTSAVARFYYEYKDEGERKRVVGTALLTLIALAAGMVLICWPFSKLLAGSVLGDSALDYYVQLSLVTFALNAVLEIPLTYIRIRERSVLYSIVALSRLACGLSLNIYFIVVLELGILGILYSGLITSVIFSVFMLVWCIKEVGICFDRHLCTAMIFFGAPLILNSFGMFVINFGDRFLLKQTWSIESVGVYSLGYKIGMGLISFLIGQPFFMIWSVRRYGLVKEEGGMEKYGQIFLLYSLLLLSLCLLLTIFSREMIFLLAPPEYSRACYIVPLVAFGYFFREISDFFRGAFMIVNRTSLSGAIILVVMVYCVINYAIFIPMYGDIGAAFATISTFIFMAFIHWYYAQKIMPVNYRFDKVVYILLFFMMLGGGAFFIGDGSISVLSLSVKFLVLVFGIVASFFIAFSKSEREFIWSFISPYFSSKDRIDS
ncbi:MAG: lipopolysaccharide biosynthesis protein [Desulfobulbus sp.]|jgi:O-antigen/teichoic acid export membrane protein